MQQYYNRRAEVYEQIYHREDPARQAELHALGAAMCKTLEGQDVLEIACGTGYWTERVCKVARSVLATDASEETLAIAASKQLPSKVTIMQADAYTLEGVGGPFTGALANFWFSHIPRSRLGEFLSGLHGKLTSGAHVFMADNCFVPGVGGDLVAPEGSDDTFKRRTLEDGSEYLILKNYYSEAELTAIFAPYADQFKVHVGTNYWWLSFDPAPQLAKRAIAG
jgi:SAM-dependent methyltransferase